MHSFFFIRQHWIEPVRRAVNFHQEENIFSSGRNFIFIRKKIIFHQGENLLPSKGQKNGFPRGLPTVK
jgi:hypothetical protein